jgi:predicted branched-subunit amino acid permease
METQVMSLTVYSAAGQMAVVQLLSTGAPAFTILLATLMMNLHHVLYGLSLAKRIEFSRVERVIAAYLLTDTAYAASITAGGNFSFLFGAELSIFLAWNLCTALTLLLGHFVTVPPQLGFIVPLTFFVLLISSIKTRLEVWVALFSAAATVVCLSMQLGAATVLIVGVTGALVGSRLAR